MTLASLILLEAGHSNGNSDCRPVEIQREADRSKETWRERLIFFLSRTSLPLTGGNDDTRGRPSPSRSLKVRKLEALKTPRGNENIKGLAVHHGYH